MTDQIVYTAGLGELQGANITTNNWSFSDFTVGNTMEENCEMAFFPPGINAITQKPTIPRLKFVVYDNANNRGARKNTPYTINLYGTSAIWAALWLSPGKTISLQRASLTSVPLPIIFRNPETNKIQTLMVGGTVIEKATILISSFDRPQLGNDAEAWLAKEFAHWEANKDPFWGRPRMWNVAGTPDNDEWRRINDIRSKVQFTPGMKYLGYAKVVQNGNEIIDAASFIEAANKQRESADQSRNNTGYQAGNGPNAAQQNQGGYQPVQNQQSNGYYPNQQQGTFVPPQQQNGGYQPPMQQNNGYQPVQQNNGYQPIQQNNGVVTQQGGYQQTQQQNGGYQPPMQQNNGPITNQNGYQPVQQQNNGYNTQQQNNGYNTNPYPPEGVQQGRTMVPSGI